MHTLGVNGWVTGVHDPAAAIFRDGELVAAAEEERFSRRKHAFDQLPFHAIEYCLHAAGITAGDLDHLAIGWDTGMLLRQSSTGATSLPEQVALDFYLPTRFFPERKGRRIAVHSIEHHLAHAAGAFASSPFEESAILVVDGSGEYASTTLAQGDRRRGVRLLRSYPFRESLGIFYQVLTDYLGFGAFQEGRLMGLAAYGTPRYADLPDIDLDAEAPAPMRCGKEDDVLAAWRQRFEAVTGHPAFTPRRVFEPAWACGRHTLDLSDLQKDMAASGQHWVERQMSRLAVLAMDLTGMPRLVLSGGVALNCPANRRIAQLGGCEDVFVPSAPGDAGVAIGAACVVLWESGIPVRIPTERVYSGPAFAPQTIHSELGRFGVRFSELKQPEEFVARAIAEQKVVAWMQGGMEFGPRALGHRSILADPRSVEVRDRVNRIKDREAWRPLAPCVKAEQVGFFFEQVDSPFMSFAVPGNKRAASEAPGALHHDGTARLQTVSADVTPTLWAILDAFERATGLPLVLNTSFNIGPEPIVCAPGDAIRSFFASGIDLLVIEGFVVSKD